MNILVIDSSTCTFAEYNGQLTKILTITNILPHYGTVDSVEKRKQKRIRTKEKYIFDCKQKAHELFTSDRPLYIGGLGNFKDSLIEGLSHDVQIVDVQYGGMNGCDQVVQKIEFKNQQP